MLSLFCVLLLILFSTFVHSACPHCFGNAASDGCDGTGTKCPWNAAMTANLATVAAAAGGVLVCTHLSAKFQRLFPPKMMDIISSLVVRLGNKGKAFTYATTSTYKQIMQAIQIGSTTTQDAIRFFHELIDSLDPGDEKAEFLMKKYLNNIAQLKLLDTKVTQYSSLEGAVLFVCYKLSTVVCGIFKSNTVSLEFCAEAVEDDSASYKSFTAALVRPKDEHQAYSLIHLTVLTLDSFGLCPLRVFAPFLEEVFYEPVRMHVLPWPVAFESVIIYIKMVEASPTMYTLGDVVHKAGGLDSIRAQALVLAKTHYPSFFRTPGGNPGIVKDIEDKDPGNKKGIYNNGEPVTRCDMSAKKGCGSWNNDAPHYTKNIKNGACIFRQRGTKRNGSR